MNDVDLADMQAHYALGQEAARLDGAFGVVEFERTKEIVLRGLPEPPAVVADIGGGPGRYALWLADLGYTVEHRDLRRKLLERESGVARIRERGAKLEFARHLGDVLPVREIRGAIGRAGHREQLVHQGTSVSGA